MISFSALKSIDAPAFWLGGGLVSKRTQAKKHKMAERIAMMRIAHGNPILGAANRTSNGKITPPKSPAVEAIPVARSRRTLNQCPTHEMAGVKRVHPERPHEILNERKTW